MRRPYTPFQDDGPRPRSRRERGQKGQGVGAKAEVTSGFASIFRHPSTISTHRRLNELRNRKVPEPAVS